MSFEFAGVIEGSWDLELDSDDLSAEEIFGYPESELTAERVFSMEYLGLPNLFYNPLDADTSEIVPKYLQDNRGDYIFAPGLLHWLYGPSETGKSFIALCASLETAGIYLSLEMGARQMGTRVRKMSYHHLDSSRFIFPEFFPEVKTALAALTEVPPTVVVVDSFAELALACGADTNNDQDVGRVLRDYIRPLCTAGHAVIVVDHIAKNPLSNEYPLGTQNKKSQSDICMHIERDKDSGLLELKVTKDRYYIYDGRFLGPKRNYGVVEITEAPVRVKIHREGFEEFMPIKASSSQDRQTQDAVMKLLREVKQIQKSHIRHKISASDKKIDKALAQLREGGWVSIQKGKSAEGYACNMVSPTDKTWTPASRLYGN